MEDRTNVTLTGNCNRLALNLLNMTRETGIKCTLGGDRCFPFPDPTIGLFQTAQSGMANPKLAWIWHPKTDETQSFAACSPLASFERVAPTHLARCEVSSGVGWAPIPTLRYSWLSIKSVGADYVMRL